MLIDTCAWVEFLNATEKGERVRALLRESSCFTSLISLAELGFWCAKNNLDAKKVAETVKKLSSVIGLDEQTLLFAGLLKFEKRKKTVNFGTIDAILLSTAKQYNLKIITADRHFEGENAELL